MQRRDFLAQFAAASVLLWQLRGVSLAQAAQPPGEAIAPLDSAELALLAALTEGIIPETDTPGAIGAGVPPFLALLFTEWFTPTEQKDFRAGLRAADAEALQSFGKSFAACTAADQLETLRRWDRAALAAPHGAPRPFFGQLKALTLVAYYTSEVGQEVELKAQFGAGAELADGPVTAPPPFAL